MAYTQNLTNFIPEVWSKQLLKNWDDIFVMGKFVNTGYEGEIKKFGDTVHVPYLGNITVSDYDNTAADPIAYEATPDYSDTLTVDQRKYWAFKVEDIEAAQADMDVRGQYTRRAAVAMKDTVESWLLGSTFYSAVGQVLDATAATARADSTAYALGDRVKPAPANSFVYTCTTAGTSAAAPPSFGAVIGATTPTARRSSPARVTGFRRAFRRPTSTRRWCGPRRRCARPTPGWRATCGRSSRRSSRNSSLPPRNSPTPPTAPTNLLAKGLFGRLSGFILYVSNNVAGAGTDANPFRISAGNPDLVSFAEQITDTEAIRLESEFATGVRGLMVYGGKIFDRNKQAGIVIEAQV